MSNKTELNLYAHNKGIPTPVYASIAERLGFSSTVTVGGKEYRSTEIRKTKKAAENDAAGVAFKELTCVVERPVDSATAKLERLSLKGPEASAIEAERPEPQEAAQAPFGAVRITTPQIMPPRIDAPDSLVPLPASYSPRASRSVDADLSKKLKQLNDYCKDRDLTEPTFTISEQSSTFKASITIGDRKDIVRTEQSYTSFQDAKLAVIELVIDYLTTCESKYQSRFVTWLPFCSSTSLCFSHHIGTTPNSLLQQPPTTPSHNSTLTPLIPPAFFERTPPPSSSPSFTLATPTVAPLLTRSPSLSPPSSLTSPEPTTGPTQSRDSGTNSKGQLDHYCQKNHIPLPKYTVEYPKDHVGYLASVSVGDKVYSSSIPHQKKKMAESEVAALALLELEGRGGGGGGREERPQGVGGATSTAKEESSGQLR